MSNDSVRELWTEVAGGPCGGADWRRVPSGAASTYETFDRDGRRLLRESGIPLGPVGPILLSPAGGTMRHGRRSVPQATSRIPPHRSCSRRRPAPLSPVAREKDALPYFPRLGLRSATVKGWVGRNQLLVLSCKLLAGSVWRNGELVKKWW